MGWTPGVSPQGTGVDTLAPQVTSSIPRTQPHTPHIQSARPRKHIHYARGGRGACSDFDFELRKAHKAIVRVAGEVEVGNEVWAECGAYRLVKGSVREPGGDTSGHRGHYMYVFPRRG